MTAEAVFAQDRQHLIVEFRGFGSVAAGTLGERAISPGLEKRVDRMIGGIRDFRCWICLNPRFRDFMPRFPECILRCRSRPALSIIVSRQPRFDFFQLRFDRSVGERQ